MTSIFYKKKFKQKITVSEKLNYKAKQSLRKSEAKGSEKIDSDHNKFRENLKNYFFKNIAELFN